MPRYDLMMHTGVIREYKPYKPPRRPLVEHIGITGVELTLIVSSVVVTTAFLILFFGWWIV